MASVAQALSEAGIHPGDRCVVAVSGGVDSMVLLDALVRLAPRLRLGLHVAHIHHGLRGRSADRDAAFVAAAAARHALSVSVDRLAAETRPRGTSVQVWAREARYSRLETVRRRTRAGWTLTAHTEDDQAETVLLNLLRGTGLRGLAGIPQRRGHIVRPLLSVSREAIATYAAARGVAYREDASNRRLAYRRNRIRAHLLPMLAREYNPRIKTALAALAVLAREDEAALESRAATAARAALRQRGSTVALDLARLRTAPSAIARRLFHEAFRRISAGRHGLTRRHLDAIGRLADVGAAVSLPGGLRAWVAAHELRFGPAAPARRNRRARRDIATAHRSAEVALRPGSWVRWAPGACSLRIRRVVGKRPRTEAEDPTRELLSARVLDGPVSVRGWRPGDRFRPLGLAGTKKLQDFFVDAKIPRKARARVPLLVAADRIAWVVGYRIADEFRWAGERTGCMAEVRFAEGARGVPAGQNALVRR